MVTPRKTLNKVCGVKELRKEIMELNDFYKTLGKISYSFSRLDFLISHIAVDLGISKSPYEFYAQTNFEKKIKRLENGIENLECNKLKSKFLLWSKDLDEKRKKRNSVVHSIILQNMDDNDDYLLYNYRKTSSGLSREVLNFNTKDFDELEKDLVEIHNIGFELLSDLKSTNIHNKKRMSNTTHHT